MNLIDRAKKIILTPKTEWDVIAGENTPTQELIVSYVLPLAAAAAIASFIGTALFMGMLGSAIGASIGFMGAAVGAIIHVIMAVVSVFVIGFIVDALAPTFGGQKNMQQALKLAAYAYTPGWVFGLLAIIPFLGWLAALIGGLYGIYVFYLGLPKLMKNPQEKSVPYVVVVIVCAIVLWMVISFVTAAVMGMGMMGAGAMYRGSTSSSPAVTFDRDSRLGKLEEFGKKMEEAGKRMEAAQKSGDQKAQTEEAMKTLGMVMSGGKGVEPVSIDDLKPLVPDKLVGLPRSDLRTEKSGIAGMMVSKAEATYTEGQKHVDLEIVDTGGMAGLMGLATWVGVQGEREDASHRESTRRDGDRMVHESVSKTGGRNEYTVVIGDRFVVSAKGNADLDALKSAVGSIDVAKLATKKG